MAKKKSSFNMAEEIRALLKADKSLSGGQVLTALKKKYPRQRINQSSCSVAYSGARKRLGIGSKNKKTVVRRKRPVSRSAVALNIEALRAAKQFLAACDGDTDLAITALKQLSSLQMS